MASFKKRELLVNFTQKKVKLCEGRLKQFVLCVSLFAAVCLWLSVACRIDTNPKCTFPPRFLYYLYAPA